jgi:FAD/FMN-containing dehydrogenase
VAAERQAAAAAAICERHGGTVAVLSGAEEHDAWRTNEERLWGTSDAARATDTIVKMGVLPTDVAAALEQIERVCGERQLAWHAGGRAAIGVIVVRLSGGGERHSAAVAGLRQWAVTKHGSAVIVSADSTVRSQTGPWGDVGDALTMMQAIKARFDPRGTLSPGRGPGGF